MKFAKSEKEIEADKKKRQALGASADPRDPRNDMSTPQSLQELNSMTKYMIIP